MASSPTAASPTAQPAQADAVSADHFIRVVTEWVQQLVRMNSLVAAGLGITSTDLHCLHVLEQHGETTTGRLGARVGLSAGAASRMIDRLESAGFVTRRRDGTDRRKVTVAATPTGLERAGAYYDGLTRRTRADMARLKAEELQVVIRFVESSVRSVDAEAGRLVDRIAPDSGR